MALRMALAMLAIMVVCQAVLAHMQLLSASVYSFMQPAGLLPKFHRSVFCGDSRVPQRNLRSCACDSKSSDEEHTFQMKGSRKAHEPLTGNDSQKLPGTTLPAAKLHSNKHADAHSSESLANFLSSAVHSFSVFMAACFVGLVLSLTSVRAESVSEVDTVEAAWNYIKRNFYDQTFNGQDWASMRSRYIERAQRGEPAKNLIREMAASLGDRYSRVIDAAGFQQLMTYDPLGVGLVLTRSDTREVFVSNPPFENSSGAQAGIRQGDFVDAVDGQSLAEGSLLAVMDQVASGDALTVRLKLRRGPADNPVATWEKTLKRARQTTPESVVETGIVAGSDSHRVGYLRLRNFGARAPLDVGAALKRMRADGADEFVIDLRGNLGGSFQAALEIASLFLEPDSIATRVRTPAGGESLVRVAPTPNGLSAAKEPLAILVDQNSASASEVLASALRGNCRASLLGDKTFGKAKVQGVFGLPNREAIALTVAEYRGPGGAVITGGIPPDGAGPASPFARAAAVLGARVELSPSDYGLVDFDGDALRECRAPSAP